MHGMFAADDDNPDAGVPTWAVGIVVTVYAVEQGSLHGLRGACCSCGSWLCASMPYNAMTATSMLGPFILSVDTIQAVQPAHWLIGTTCAACTSQTREKTEKCTVPCREVDGVRGQGGLAPHQPHQVVEHRGAVQQLQVDVKPVELEAAAATAAGSHARIRSCECC